MAESLIADLFKTPADVRQEETDRLLEQGKASAEAYLTGAGQGGSPIAGAIRGLTATALQEMPLSMSQTVRRGMLGLSGGQVGASQAERQAAELNAVAKSAIGKKPDEIRKAAERAAELGRGDIAMALNDRADKLQKETDLLAGREGAYNILKRMNPLVASLFKMDPKMGIDKAFELATKKADQIVIGFDPGQEVALQEVTAKAKELGNKYVDMLDSDPDIVYRFRLALKNNKSIKEAYSEAFGLSKSQANAATSNANPFDAFMEQQKKANGA